jgi:DNA modification methylase
LLFYPTLDTNIHRFKHINITQKAFPDENEIEIANFNKFLDSIDDEKIKDIFKFAGMCVLEESSYTRKDGQYLRWDKRAKRNIKSNFSKGKISSFRAALLNKLTVLYSDLYNENHRFKKSKISIKEGSCLVKLPVLPSNKYDLVITSPPYCNRYDYTRTYALELAYLGLSESRVKDLRQTMLTCTVENKSKLDYLSYLYEKLNQSDLFNKAINIFRSQKAVQEILELLYQARNLNKLNNKNIPVLVENYLFEMNIVIHELFRVLSPLGRVVMVNDNVQYNGEEIPVDLILSDFAQSAGFNVDHIWILKKGKGNSSQQMGQFGRTEIRKCVYIWTKPMSFF